MQIEMTGIVCRFGSTPAVDNVDLTVNEGEFLALLGPSGSGKTTLLRIIAGLETPESGELKIDGVDALDLAPNRRKIGFVFQNYALFRHMNVARNIAFGLDVRPRGQRPDKSEIKRRVEELLDLVQMPSLGRRFPHELSGGQRQRVALARALAIEPKILLLDEPFGALDAQVRSELRVWLKSLHHRLGITSVFVTHDQEEALELADRVVIMRTGKIQQEGTPLEIYSRPVSPFIYNFLGAANRLSGIASHGVVNIPGTTLTWTAPGLASGPVGVWFRPHQIELQPDKGSAAVSGVVQEVSATGARARIVIAYEQSTIIAELTPEAWIELGLARGSSCRFRPRVVSFYYE